MKRLLVILMPGSKFESPYEMTIGVMMLCFAGASILLLTLSALHLWHLDYSTSSSLLYGIFGLACLALGIVGFSVWPRLPAKCKSLPFGYIALGFFGLPVFLRFVPLRSWAWLAISLRLELASFVLGFAALVALLIYKYRPRPQRVVSIREGFPLSPPR